jgi:hypothetical protein
MADKSGQISIGPAADQITVAMEAPPIFFANNEHLSTVAVD